MKLKIVQTWFDLDEYGGKVCFGAPCSLCIEYQATNDGTGCPHAEDMKDTYKYYYTDNIVEGGCDQFKYRKGVLRKLI